MIGFLITGTLSDFKESEKLPGDLSNSLSSLFDEAYITYQNKKDIRSIIVDNNETHSILVSMNKKNTDIDLEQLKDHSINQIFEIIEERKFLNQPSLL